MTTESEKYLQDSLDKVIMAEVPEKGLGQEFPNTKVSICRYVGEKCNMCTADACSKWGEWSTYRLPLQACQVKPF